MNTLEFFKAVLPEDGPYYLVAIKKGGGVSHVSCSSLEEMASKALELDAHENLSIYHACSSYKNEYIVEDEKKRYRVPANWGRAKSFWIDIDCGKEKADEGKGYETKGEAAKAVQEFCIKTGLPGPLVVDSGGGLHCYWVLTKPIPPETWRPVAEGLKALLTHHGVLQDQTCTADFSRILRPAGTTNRKREPLGVRVKNQAIQSNPRTFAATVSSALKDCKVTPQIIYDSTLNDDLTSHVTHLESSAEIAANHCAQMAQMRDTKGDVNYEHWRGVIGVIKHCNDGIALAESWSERRKDTGHAQMDVSTRFNTWSTGPSTCEFFSHHNPSGCSGCPHKGKIKSPIILGKIAPAVDESKVIEVVQEEIKIEVEIPTLPESYNFMDGYLVRTMKDKDGILKANPFCRGLFYPTKRIRKEDGKFSLSMRMHLPTGKIRDFDIQTNSIESGQKLSEALLDYEITHTHNKDAPMHLTAYVKDSLEKLKRESEEMNTMKEFGWKHDMESFLIGDRLYHKDGTVRQVLISGNAVEHAQGFQNPSGKLKDYCEPLNFVYARKGMEPMQYAISSVFGSILTPLGESLYHGMLLGLTSDDTSKGKTTTAHAALYAFGNADKASINTPAGATQNAMWSQLGTYKNLPMLFDEMTRLEGKKLSELFYAISAGTEPKRLGVIGNDIRQRHQYSWATLALITGNCDFHSSLAAERQNTQAEAVRYLQIKTDLYRVPQLDGNQVADALTKMSNNAGVAGEKFIQHVVTHLDEVKQQFAVWMQKLVVMLPQSMYRFYRNQGACALTAADILKNLGIVEFDLDELLKFTVRLMRDNCNTVMNVNSSSPDDAINQMINDLTPRIIYTEEYRDTRDARGAEEVQGKMNQAPAGRMIRGKPSGKQDALAGRLYLVKKDMREWCLENRISPNKIISHASDLGVLISEGERFTVGRGTQYVTGNLNCVVFDMSKLEGSIDQKPKLVVHQGEKNDGDTKHKAGSGGSQ